jgi:hypothetical protein
VDPVSLATAAVSLLAAFFKQTTGKLTERASEAIAESAVLKAKGLHERMLAKLAPGTYQRAILDGVQAEPDDPQRQAVLKAELTKLIARDQPFASELAELVAQVEQAGGIRATATDTGVVAGRDANLSGHYVAGRDMQVGTTADDER